ncbi:MAG: hypothetical protein HN790_15220 [Methylococcales bacterium]|jgi:signal transduction histidine kinase|nr:hypothetical protein [Methylococcales bacterium]
MKTQQHPLAELRKTPPDKLAALTRSLEPFNEFTNDEIQVLSTYLHGYLAIADDEISSTSDILPFFAFIQDGSINILHADSKECIATLKTGDSLGCLPSQNSPPFQFNAVTTEITTLIIMPHRQFSLLENEHPHLADMLYKVLAYSLNTRFEKIALTLDQKMHQLLEERTQLSRDLNQYQQTAANISDVSHELRSPLTAIIGYGELLGMNTELDAAQMLYINNIQQASQDLLNLVNNTLDQSKIQSGQIDFHCETVDITMLIEATKAIVFPVAQKRNIQLWASAPKHMPSINGDFGKLKQILVNHLSNACKFTQDGTVTLLAKHLPQKARMQFTITDSGIGMTEQQINHIFEPYQQADSSISNRFGGTGLGLSISQKLCELMQGEIRIQSTPGVGTSFIIEIPDNLAHVLEQGNH